ncbi:MAG: ComF family protein [Polyangiales bacterium]
MAAVSVTPPELVRITARRPSAQLQPPRDRYIRMRPLALALLHTLYRRRCSACALPLYTDESLFCAGCGQSLCPSLAPGAAFAYGGALREALLRCKVGGRADIGQALGQLLARSWSKRHPQPEVLLPVPLHPARLRQRGFNQSLLLAVPLARRLARPCRPSWLRRVRATQPQAACDGAPARWHNVAGSFQAHPVVRGRHILLIDDIRTTGATFAAARQSLLAAGARCVDCYALAQAGASALP